eukprot:CAMPEP_0113711536 /NCGR_PEP_ID=MMETSP0038_2-20120614/30822_1 /TAXON_ID=2898 /ORGANISM="Cryptomonas paramecium" /LENGTH=78 /DNA_ID=CAMNT_0000637825 /DNA_START=1 /DNA_END=233 /DNA_ORIENTATION=+ /assembly_acc=CAM_ASM_000170
MNNCGAAARGDPLWDNHFCALCDGEIVAWPSEFRWNQPTGAARRSSPQTAQGQPVQTVEPSGFRQRLPPQEVYDAGSA